MNLPTARAGVVIAVVKHLISDSSLKGLLRKPIERTAPVFLVRISSNQNYWRLKSLRLQCLLQFKAFNPGICTSVIRHVVSAITLDSRKCSAELKVTALYPKDSISCRIPSRASASSSTIEINGTSDINVSQLSRNHSSYSRNLI
jgi:hypothetical protein